MDETHSDASRPITVALFLLHAFYDLFISKQHHIGLARCLTNFSTVSTLQDCNFTSLSLRTLCSGPNSSNSRFLEDPPFHTWIALACIQVRFLLAIDEGLASLFVAAKHEENERKREWQGTDEMATSTWLELSDCCGHCKHVLDLEHHHT